MNQPAAATAAMLSAIALVACAGVLGVEDGVLDSAKVDVADAAGGPDPPIAPMPDAGSDIIGVVVPDSCPSEQADLVHGVFVSPGGSGQPDCGSSAAPCNAIQLGLTRAKMLPGSAIVYVDTGTYQGTVQAVGGITVQGGWDNLGGGVWRRQCVSTRAASVVIAGAPPTGVGVVAQSITSEATFDTLTISVSSGSLGITTKSSYGVVVSGPLSVLTLRDVTVNAGNGGEGSAGTPGAKGSAGSRCFGLSGTSGGNGAEGAGAQQGSFGPTGYVSAAGGTGALGTPGFGTKGHAGTCGDCVTCDVDYPTCSLLASTSTCGAAGSGGCGGGGGSPGTGGEGGGSSVAVFAWEGKVNVFGGGLRAGDGGKGGAGGSGGAGGAGSTGTSGGDAQACYTTCSSQTGACAQDTNVAFKGGAGGTIGGTGGTGGSGGGGAGGASYAIFQGAGALVTPMGTVLAHGMAGPGGLDGGAPGLAADRSP